jgi:proliferating cell nuclear antigen PCNA
MLRIKTSQISVIKNLLEGITSLLNESNIEFHPTDGVTIREVDKTGKIIVFVKLEKDNFDFYEVPSRKAVGVDLCSLLKCFKGVGMTDILEIQINDLITIIIKNSKITKKFTLPILTLPIIQGNIAPINFNYQVTMNSKMFNSWCKNIWPLTEKINITTTSNQISFTGTTEHGEIDFTIEQGRSLMIETSEDTTVDSVTGEYDIKYFLLFNKCSNISEDVILFIKQGHPLVIQYNLSSLGILKLCLQK